MSTIAIETARQHRVATRSTHTPEATYLTTALLVAMVVLAPVVIAAALTGSTVVVVSAGITVALLAVIYLNRKVFAANA